MSKIYSRKRFILKPKFKIPIRNAWKSVGLLDNDNGSQNSIVKRKSFKLIIALIVAVLFYQFILRSVEPVFETMCEEKVKSIATVISNQESTKAMNKYQYEELYTIEKDASGNVTFIKSNVAPINNMISDLTEGIQNRFDDLDKSQICIPAGNLFGVYFLSGVGPDIPVKVATSGTIDTEIKSEFVSKGINQTLHRVYVNFQCSVKILTPIKNYEKSITNQFIIAENVIVGNIPDTYYNLDGVDGSDDMLNIIN